MYELPVSIESDQSSATLGELGKIEGILGCKIPEDYRHFLESCNGASIAMPPDEIGAAVKVKWLRSDLTRAQPEEVADFPVLFFIGGIWAAAEVISEMEQFFVYGDQSLGFLPRHYLPISQDNGGSDYIIDVSDGPQRGHVYLWPVNTNVSFGQERNEYIGFVARSFTEFVNEKIIATPKDW